MVETQSTRSISASQLSLQGKTALVVGGSSGIGNAIAHGFQDSGARVAIAARTPAKVEAATQRLQELDPTARGYVIDAARPEEIDELVATAVTDFGHIDILVACQGMTILKPAEEVTPAEYDEVMQTNLRSVFFTCTRFGRHMLELGNGSIITIASLAAHRGWPLASIYAASKHGVAGLTKTLAAEWADRGVRVNAISPGFFMTELNQSKMSSKRKENALLRTPMGRFGQLDELVGAAIYLASPAAGFVTGTVLNVDGGYLASGI
ncbi:glucose 1-dehydrogenase [Microvirga sp. 3-52]|uniref:SDR family NAD(P)-dependent oxidoreductase n=1 Tax=Microvirga sp. 3-52 TaxID=2792425 RepID=UPI001AC028D4|nr:glucose 1-dehydrogenase [Microvirga sp. 3-52]MBO1906750.1 glucose 1-dehydrogenase [Microvirga sp. 3-52]MBS7453895.1 glucose 1-dehydrogenase [Microvirga sp. 3-52]